MKIISDTLEKILPSRVHKTPIRERETSEVFTKPRFVNASTSTRSKNALF